MKKLLYWKKNHTCFPLDSYTWNLLLGEKLKNVFVQSGILQYGDIPVDTLTIKGEEYQIEYIGNKYYAINDDSEFQLSSKDVLPLHLDKKALADKIRELLKIGSVSSAIPNCDAYSLGDLRCGNGFRVFLCLSESKYFYECVRRITKDIQPIIISFTDISSELQELLYDLNGKFFVVNELFDIEGNDFVATDTLQELLGKPRQKKTSTDYYSWKATGFHQPEYPTLDMLKITITSTTSLTINFDGEGGSFDYRDISIFRKENTGGITNNWTILRFLAAKKTLEKDETLRKQVTRFNTAFRDFFGFHKKVIPFKFSDNLLQANFMLTAKKEYKKERKKIFNGGGISDADVVQDWLADQRREY